MKGAKFILISFLLLISVALSAQNIVSDDVEKAALLAFYNATDQNTWSGTPWTVTAINNFPNTPLEGVTIQHGDVVGINLYYYHITGTLASDLNNLTELQALQLVGNNFTGPLPNLGNLTKLVTLDLSENTLTGNFPAWLSSLTNLTTVSFMGNPFVGPLPASLSNLTQLQTANFEGTVLNMAGAVPSSFLTISTIQSLDLSNCNLDSASISGGFSGMMNLSYLVLRNNPGLNQPSGTLADIFLNLPNLQTLDLSINHIQLLPSHFNELPRLTELDLDFNDFSSFNILGNIVDTLQTMPSLHSLGLDDCKIIGLPTNFNKMVSITNLYLSTNPSLDATQCEEIGRMPNLNTLYFEGDNLTSLPVNIDSLEALRSLYAGGNKLNPVDNVILQIPALQTLDLSSNGITTLPSWFGSGNMTSIQTLYLQSNGLSQLPATMADMTNLTELDLANNQLSGSLPTWFSQLNKISILFLNNNQLTSPLPDFSSWNSLQVLSLAYNDFSGAVPTALANNSFHRSQIDLSHNQFDTLAAFRADPTLDLNVSYNRLSFSNILKVARPIQSYLYIPQDTLLVNDSILNVTAYQGDSLVLVAAPDNGTSGTVYQWWHIVNGQPVAVTQPSDTASYTNPNFTPADTGTYYYTATNPAVPGLTLTSPKYHVKLSLCRTDASVYFGYSRYLCAYEFFPPKNSKNCKSVAYKWNFGDGKTSASNTPMHAFTTSGTYNVSLTLTFQCGGFCRLDTTVIRQVVYDAGAPFTGFKDSLVSIISQVKPVVLSSNASTFSDSWSLPQDNVALSTVSSFLNGSQGVWRNEGNYVYKVPRTQSAQTDVAHDGTYDLQLFNWQQAEFNAVPNWIKTNTMTQYSPYSYELENQDVLGIYTAALYDYGGHLPSANGVNMRNNEMGFTSFEHLNGNITGNFIFGAAAVPQYKTYSISSGSGNLAIVEATMGELSNVAVADLKISTIGAIPLYGVAVPFFEKFGYYKTDSLVCKQRYATNPKWTMVVLQNAPSAGAWSGNFNIRNIVTPAVVPQIDSTTTSHSGRYSLHIGATTTFRQDILQLDSAKTYLINAWVSVNNPNLLTPVLGSGLGIDVVIKDRVGVINSTFSFQPSGPIIEGWQQVKGTFICPINDSQISLTFNPGSTGQAWYDDLRLHPEKGNMKSYVYDLNDYSLRSTLDEDNFASFYYYDKEGNLNLVKKETEKGVKTISENASYIVEQR